MIYAFTLAKRFLQRFYDQTLSFGKRRYTLLVNKGDDRRIEIGYGVIGEVHCSRPFLIVQRKFLQCARQRRVFVLFVFRSRKSDFLKVSKSFVTKRGQRRYRIDSTG